MSTLNPDVIQLRVLIDGTPARKELAELTQEAQEVKSAMKGLKKTSDEFVEGSKRISEITARQAELRKEIGLDSLSMKELNAEYGRARAAMIAATPRTEQWVQAAARVNELKEARRDLTDQNRIDMRVWEAIRGEMALGAMTTQQLGLETKHLKAILEDPATGAEEYARTAAALDRVTDRTQQLTSTTRIAAEAWETQRKGIQLAEMNTEQLGLETKRLQAILAKPDLSAEEHSKAAAALAQVKERTEQLTNAKNIAAQAWERDRKGMQLVEMTTQQLAMETERLKAVMANPRTGGPERAQAARELALVKDRTEQLTNANRIAADAWEHQRKGMKLTEMSMEQLRMESARLKAKLEVMAPGDMALGQTRKALIQTESRLKSLESGLGPFGRAWASVKTQVAGAGAVIGAMFAGGAIINGFRNMVKSAAEYSDAIADVRKTTGLSLPVVKALSSELSGMDTRTSRKELLELARDAGKLGLSAKEDVMSFVKAGNQIRVALGEDLGDDAIKNIGKLVDLFKLKDTFGLEQSMLKVGSAINELGMSSTASEGYMVEFLKRMGGIAPLAGITIQETLALGATMDSLGQTSEVSTTALSKILVKLGTDVPRYAKLAGVSLEEFSEALRKNALDALVLVLEGTKKTGGGMEELAATLGDVGIDSARAASTFAALAANTDKLREQTVISNRAFADGSSVSDEYKIKNENLAATLAKLSREFNRLIASNRVVAIFESLANAARSTVEWLKRNANMVAFVAKAIGLATVAWLNYRIQSELWAKGAAIRIAVTRAMALANGVLTGSTISATRAMVLFRTAWNTNPLGLITTALATTIGLFIAFADKVKSSLPGLKDLSEAEQQSARDMQTLYTKILATNKGSEERKKLITELKALYPDLLKNINAETASNVELGKSIEMVNKHLINKAIIQRKEGANQAIRDEAADVGFEFENRVRTTTQTMQRWAAQYGVNVAEALDNAKTPLEGLQNALDKVKQSSSFSKAVQGQGGDGVSYAMLTSLQGQVDKARDLYAEYGQIQDKAVVAEKEKTDLLRQFGLLEEEAGEEGVQAKKKNLFEITDMIEKARAALATTEKGSHTEAFLKREIDELEAQAAVLRKAGGEVVRTVAQIDAEIAALTKQRPEESSDRAQYAAFTKQIEALEREKRRITGESAKTGQAQAQENLDALEESMRQWREKMRQETLSDDEKELAQLDAKHEEELRKYKEQQAKLIAAGKLTPEQAEIDVALQEEQNLNERTKLIETHGDRKADALKESNAKVQAILGEAHNAELQADVEFYAQEIEQGKAANRNVLDLERAHKDALLKLYEQNAKDLLGKETDKWTDLILLAKKKLQDFDAANAKAGITPDGAVLEDRKKLSDGIIDLEKAQTKALKRINDDRRRKEKQAEHEFNVAMRQESIRKLQNFAMVASASGDLVNSITQYMDAGIAAAESRADSDGERTEEEIANIERLKQSRREAALVAIAVQGAAAIANGIASAMSLPWPANLVAAIGTVATVVGLIAQAKAMMNQSSGSDSTSAMQPALNAVPEGEKGMLASGDGRTITSADGGGILDGPRHGDDGIKMVNPKTGRIVAEVEGDETALILSRAATQANADLIPRMLQASKEGKRMDFFQAPKQPNVQRMQQAMRVVHMRDGGAVGSAATFAATGGTTGKMETLMGQMVAYMGQMAKNQKETAEATKRMPTTFKGVVSLNPEYDRQMAQWKDMKDRYSAGRKTGG